MTGWTRDVAVILAAVLAAAAAAVLTRPTLAVSGGIVKEWQTKRVLRTEWSTLADGTGLLAGSIGDVGLIEFGDYQCQGCLLLESKLQAVLSDLPSSRGLVYRHFPLEGHRYAEPAAIAAICAEFQGAFAAMHRQLFTVPDWSAEPDWMFEARGAGVSNLEEFEHCLDSDAAAERLSQDLELARLLDLQGTPSLVTPTGVHFGQPLSDTWLLEQLRSRHASR